MNDLVEKSFKKMVKKVLLEKIKKAMIISRPAFWPILIAAYGMGVFVSGGHIGILEIAEMLLLSFPLSFYIFGINDIYDISTDTANPRKKNWIWGTVLKKEDQMWVKNLAAVFAFLIFCVSLISANIAHIIVTAACIFITYSYSAPPFRLKSVPVFDSLVNCLFGLGPFAMGYTVSGGWGFLNPQFILISLIFSAAHAVFAVADMENDLRCGIRTFATEFGPRIPVVFSFIIFILNIPFAYNILKSMAAALFICSIGLAYLIIYPKTSNARTFCSGILMIALLWIAYVAIAGSLGFETFHLPA